MTQARSGSGRPPVLPARAANIELDRQLPIDNYVVTGRALDVVVRWVHALNGTTPGRAWSITGPYGSGKSSLALFLAALAEPAASPSLMVAISKLAAADPQVAKELLAARTSLQAAQNGFVVALATADHGPLVPRLARSLAEGARRHPLADNPVFVREVPHLEELALAAPSADAAARLVKTAALIADVVPVLLVIDELGQALHYAAESKRLGEFYLLQQLAEQASSAKNRPIFFFTIQHLALADYAGGVGQRERREWGKVQGRFQDIAFVEGHEETIAVIERVMADMDVPRREQDEGAAWAAVTDLGLQSLFPDGRQTVRAVYPLHPLALLALPYLCATYGQRERSLFSFIQADEPGTVRQLIKSGAAKAGQLIGLDHLYDYFVNSVRSTSDFAPAITRWLEIDRRIRETIGLPKEDVRLLKIVGLLNLVSQGGVLRASRTILGYAMDSTGRSPVAEALEPALERLTADGLVTYRSFADEYRVWRGTDFDLAVAVNAERSLLELDAPSKVVSLAIDFDPIIAMRHMQQTGIFRYFDSAPLDERSPANVAGNGSGLVAYWLGDPDSLAQPLLDRPTILLRAGSTVALREACLEAASLQRVLENRRTTDLDAVARQ